MKNPSFIFMIIGLLIISFVLIDILLMSNSKENLGTFIIIWVCNLISITYHVIANKREGSKSNEC